MMRTSNRIPQRNWAPTPTPSTPAQAVGYAPWDGRPSLGQAARPAGCPTAFWPFVGGAVTWAFFGKVIMGVLGIGRTAAERGVEQLRGYVEPVRARLPGPAGSRERRRRRR